jgi:arginyl-tRNA synthetase
MYYLDRIKQNLAEKINRLLNADLVAPDDFTSPPNPNHGDLSLPCFKLAKQLSKAPAQIADELVAVLEPDEYVQSYKAAGPYLNFILTKNKMCEDIISEISETNDQYGTNSDGQGKRVMVEFSNANTHKEYHVGHLRNLCYGDAVTRILKANGNEAIPVSYINDFGIHVAKTLWAYNEYYKNEPLPDNKGFFLGQIYVRASAELEKNTTAKQLVGGYMKMIESRQGAEYELWQKTREWSIDQFAKIYDELGIKFEKIFYESEYIDKGLELIKKLESDGILKKSEGALIADLEEHKLGVLVILRSDGTALYPVADLPLAVSKIEDFKLDKSIYVVDIRQGLYFKQLFKLLELMGYRQNFRHLGYEFVKLPTGMMSSRSGNVITYEELREALLENEIKETSARHPDWGEEKISGTARVLANAVIKFEMNKVGSGAVITFDMPNALRFEGFTAAYLLYTYARLQSILKKSQIKNGKSRIVFECLKDPKEHGIIMKLASYPDAIKKAGGNFDPSEIAKYLFDLAQLLNDYYHSVPILKADDQTKDARLVLVDSSGQILKNGLNLLGMETLNEM